MADKMKCIQVLLPALITNKEQERMTVECQKSIISLEHCVKLTVDKQKYEAQVAGVWNNFLDTWRGKDYDYLMVTANDTVLDPNAIDYAVKCMEDNKGAGIVSLHVERDLEAFKRDFGQYEYSGKLTRDYHSKDPANFLIRKGVIEAVGGIDEEFPCEFVERDYIRRCALAGYSWIEPVEVLNYHPPVAGTIGNDQVRLQKALRKYLLKWGGDAGQEKFDFPYNDARLDYTFTGKYND